MKVWITWSLVSDCRNNYLTLDVYFKELQFQSVTQVEAYTVVNFFSKYVQTGQRVQTCIKLDSKNCYWFCSVQLGN